MWDNRAVMHRRTAINPDQPRVMHRTLIKGDPVISAWEIDAAAE
jgi:alpha-ketoglutarate-dependent taurine dioxygenase